MACCDEDRSHLYDKVVQLAGEIHDLEFRLATAKVMSANQRAGELPNGRCFIPTPTRIAGANDPDCDRHDQTMGKPRTRSE